MLATIAAPEVEVTALVRVANTTAADMPVLLGASLVLVGNTERPDSGPAVAPMLFVPPADEGLFVSLGKVGRMTFAEAAVGLMDSFGEVAVLLSTFADVETFSAPSKILVPAFEAGTVGGPLRSVTGNPTGTGTVGVTEPLDVAGSPPTAIARVFWDAA